MTKDEAIERLLELAQSRISILDGEWGCSHSFAEALRVRSCHVHEASLEVADLAAALGIDLRAETAEDGRS